MTAPARVLVIGAGIAGLTAAHELARRGFRVRVFEPAQEYNELGEVEAGAPAPPRLFGDPRLAVGGRARTQFMRAAKGSEGNFPRDEVPTAGKGYRLVYATRWDYFESEWQQSPLMHPDMHEFLTRGEPIMHPSKFTGILHIRVPFVFPPDLREPTREEAADALRKALKLEGRGPARIRVITYNSEGGEGFAWGVGDPFPPLADTEKLLLEVVHYLPGEHGFRFVPAAWRHLRSSMGEVPLLDEGGKATGSSVLDNVVPAGFLGISGQGRRLRFPRQIPSGYPPDDTVQLTLRLWRYLCTSSERRKDEYGRLSWWEYLEGFDPETGTRRHPYSQQFKRDLRFAFQPQAALDGDWCDARTCGNTLAQRYLNELRPTPGMDGVLNGPTTLVWLRPWRRYLEQYLGVDFVEGELPDISLDEEGRLEMGSPFFEPGWPADEVDYCIVATDAETAERLTSDLDPIGVVQGLRRFTTWIPPNPRGPQGPQERRWGVLPGHVPWDRFQTLTGIQFFFPSSVRLAEGCLHFLDAPWGLSAINSHQYWAVPPALDRDGFGAVLSVVIGSWYARDADGRKSPSTCTRHELAHEVWRRLREALGGSALPEPSWYHVDRFIRFEKDGATGRERPVENSAPYLMALVDDWNHRPGPEPWDPWVPSAAPARSKPLPEGLWQAPHGGYYVHWDKLVFAGTYLKTFTRVTGMEAANESARHAVNAILDHHLAHHGPSAGGPGAAPDSPGFGMTPVGEYCRIWNPERYELPELASLRALDAKLFAQGLPHVWDVLELEPQVLPLLPPLDDPGGAGPLREFLRDVCKRVATRL
jgi:hypothetical protein